MMYIGGLLFLVGLVIYLGGNFLSLGRLPGDIIIQRGNFTFYLPITTSILVSLVLSGILWLLK